MGGVSVLTAEKSVLTAGVSVLTAEKSVLTAGVSVLTAEKSVLKGNYIRVRPNPKNDLFLRGGILHYNQDKLQGLQTKSSSNIRR